MNDSSMNERYEVIEALQELRGRHEVGTYGYERADHAIGMALSRGRKTSRYLMNDVLRDAGRVLRRRWESQEDKFVSLDADPEGNHDGVLSESLCSPAPSPLELLLVDELIRQIRVRLTDMPLAMAVFDGLLDGDSISEIATANKISLSYAKVLRTRVRTAAEFAILN
ncbi:MAG: hypothetical protein ABMA13_02915 [Chthoniobacteraceae bacterium]